MSRAAISPLAAAAHRVTDSLARLELLADAGTDEAYEAELAAFHRDLKAFGKVLRRATGRTAAELAEALVR